ANTPGDDVFRRHKKTRLVWRKHPAEREGGDRPPLLALKSQFVALVLAACLLVEFPSQVLSSPKKLPAPSVDAPTSRVPIGCLVAPIRDAPFVHPRTSSRTTFPDAASGSCPATIRDSRASHASHACCRSASKLCWS